MSTQPKLQIAVLDRGFVYVGLCQITDGMLTITSARCIRRWGTTAGLGQLALTGPTEKTKLDTAGTVRAPVSALMHLLDCAGSAWPMAAEAA